MSSYIREGSIVPAIPDFLFCKLFALTDPPPPPSPPPPPTPNPPTNQPPHPPNEQIGSQKETIHPHQSETFSSLTRRAPKSQNNDDIYNLLCFPLRLFFIFSWLFFSPRGVSLGEISPDFSVEAIRSLYSDLVAGINTYEN